MSAKRSRRRRNEPATQRSGPPQQRPFPPLDTALLPFRRRCPGATTCRRLPATSAGATFSYIHHRQTAPQGQSHFAPFACLFAHGYGTREICAPFGQRRWRANGWKRNKKDKAVNVDLWLRLLDACQRHDVAFKPVKGHAGHPDNEACDRLANAAAARKDLPPDTGYEQPSTKTTPSAGDLF